MSTGAAVLLLVLGAALMLKASRVGTAFILLGLALLAMTGIKGFFFYILAPALVLFVGWVTYIYVREKKRVALEEEIGRKALQQANRSGGTTP